MVCDKIPAFVSGVGTRAPQIGEALGQLGFDKGC